MVEGLTKPSSQDQPTGLANYPGLRKGLPKGGRESVESLLEVEG